MPLSKALQTQNIDLVHAVDLANCAHSELQKIRQSAESNFKAIFVATEIICRKYEIPIVKPRIVKQQTYRDNVNLDTPEDYWRVTVFLPYIDIFLVQLKERFIKHEDILRSFQILFPDEKPINYEQIACAAHKLYNMYDSILECSEGEFVGNIKLWRNYVDHNKTKPNALEYLQVCITTCIFKIVLNLSNVLIQIF